MLNTLKIRGAAKHISVLAFMCYSENRPIFGHIFLPFVRVSSTCNQINEQEMIKRKTGFVTAPDLFGKCLRFFSAMLRKVKNPIMPHTNVSDCQMR